MAKTVNPALIIGLGGTGTKSLYETKVSLLKRYGEVPSCIKLICFDTSIVKFAGLPFNPVYVI